MGSSHYLVKVKVKNVKNAGTDDPLYVVIFGPNGSSGKLRMNNKANDFETNTTSSFKFETKDPNVKDVGFPYAIGLCKTGDDGIYIEKIDVEYHQENGSVKIAKFPTETQMGEKGDFQLTKDRFSATLYADNLKKQVKGAFNGKVKDFWIVIDNRGGTSSYENNAYPIRVSVASDMIHTASDTEKTQVKAFYTPEGKVVGNEARFELESSFSKEYTGTDAKEYVREIELPLTISINCDPGILVFQQFTVELSNEFDAFEIGSCQLNIRTKEPKPKASVVEGRTWEYIQGEDLNPEHKAVYNSLFAIPFDPNRIGGRVVGNT